MPSDPLPYCSLMALSGDLKSGAVTSRRVTEALLARIEAHDGALKSYTTVLADRALTRAAAADAELQRGFWAGRRSALRRPGLPFERRRTLGPVG